MPAGAMGDDRLNSTTWDTNPNTNQFVLMSSMSGPRGSAYDRDNVSATIGVGTRSTGALCTGIGMGPTKTMGPGQIPPNWTDNITYPENFIGGGRNVITNVGLPTEKSTPTPWVGTFLLGFGNGGNRDAGAGPAFTGFQVKIVTAAADITNGGVVETGWVNRNGATLLTGLSAFGSAVAASPAPT